jgi:DNA polymerase III delta prime subunit
MSNQSNEFLFVEKYRPRTVEDTILPKGLKSTFSQIVEGGELPNMMFSGSAGVGKTTVAKALCNQLDLDYIIINGSEDGNIDTLRTKIRQFASTVSLHGGYKVVILDEADYLNPQSTQPALRGFIEEFSNNCRFILTCNFKNKIIEPLHSRCSVYEFSIPNSEKPKIAGGIFTRVCSILDNEGVQYEKPAVAELVQKHFPDFRRVLNECQRYSMSGKIDAGILVNISDDNFVDLLNRMKEKDLKKVRSWVSSNSDLEPRSIFRKLFDVCSEHMTPPGVAATILCIGKYQYQDAFVADHELNTVACLTDIMIQAEWK